MRPTRRSFLEIGASGFAAVALSSRPALGAHAKEQSGRRFRFVQIDVFSSKRLEGNPLAVFLDARGLTDTEMQALARETNLSETTFVIPRDPVIEREQGVKVAFSSPRWKSLSRGIPRSALQWFFANVSCRTKQIRQFLGSILT